MFESVIDLKLESKILSGHEFDQFLLAPSEVSQVVSFVNPFSYGIVAGNNRLVDEVDYWFSDGALLCRLLGLKRVARYERASFDFSSIAVNVLEYCESEGKKVAFVGASPDEIGVAVNNIIRRYKKLNCVYFRNGYFNSAEAASIADELNLVQPDVVVVGMGTPAQEDFSLLCKKRLFFPAKIFTCGGFLTQTAVSSDFYHPLVKKFGLRWLQRAIKFSHVRRRLIRDYPRFVLKYLFDIYFYRLR